MAVSGTQACHQFLVHSVVTLAVHFKGLKIHSHTDRECPRAGDGIRLLKRSVWIRRSQAAEVRRVDIDDSILKDVHVVQGNAGEQLRSLGADISRLQR